MIAQAVFFCPPSCYRVPNHTRVSTTMQATQNARHPRFYFFALHCDLSHKTDAEAGGGRRTHGSPGKCLAPIHDLCL